MRLAIELSLTPLTTATVSQITVVGVVRNIATQATNVSISLEDGTGACDLKFWLNDEGEDDPRLEGVACVASTSSSLLESR